MHNRKTSVETKSLQSSAAGLLIIPPNPHRCAILISNPHFLDSLNQTQSVHNVSCAATGVKLSYTVPAGQQATLFAATAFGTAGATQVLSLQYTPSGGAATTLTTFTPSGTYSGQLQLSAGDTVAWNCTTALAASTEDLTLSIGQAGGQHGTTLVSIGAGRTPGQGIPVGNVINFLMLTDEQIGDAITASIILEDSAVAQQTYTWTEWIYSK